MQKYRDPKTPFVLEWIRVITTKLNSSLYLDLIDAGWSENTYKNGLVIMRHPTGSKNYGKFGYFRTNGID